MAQCMILADDFTGACDTGLAFARAGLHTVAVTDIAAIGEALTSADAVAVDTDSRPLASLEAAHRVRDVLAATGEACPDLVYKKVDSALRGNLTAEVCEAMRVLDRELCIVAPAFPETGRVTVGGYHLVHGVPVERTEVGRDPGTPVRGSYLPHLLEGDSTTEVRVVQLEDVAQGADHIAAMLEGMRGAGPVLVVADAASDEDLRQIALASARMNPVPLLCGSAGLAGHMGEAFELAPEVGAAERDGAPAGPVLFLTGTGESTTRRQVAALGPEGVPGYEVHLESVGGSSIRASGQAASLVSELADRLAALGAAALTLVGVDEAASRDPVARGLSRLARIGRDVMEAVPGAQVVMTGGWTARETLSAMEATRVEILEACEPGVPLSRIGDGPLSGRRMVTKGGAIGDDRTFVRVLRRLRPRARPAKAEGRPLLGITLGDPCGVGPEIVVKALANPEVYDTCRPLVIGHGEVVRRAMAVVGQRSALAMREVERPEGGLYASGTIDMVSPVEVDMSQLATGAVCAEGGRAAVAWVEAGIDLAMAGAIDAIVTAPLNKEAMNRAGHHYAGHTELLRDRTGAARARLMLATDRLSVAHVTGHIALHDVASRLSTEEVLATTRLLHDALATETRPRPRIVVLGLNPHAGESGLFGEEDDRVVRPAVDQAREAGIDATGPVPADATFLKAWRGDYDGVVAMYHDQGHVPMKLVAFDDAVNVTLGLPIIRTSVDHGTAFDIAGKGIAKEGNLVEAIRAAAALASKRH